MADAETLELEQERVDAAYAIAEQLLEARDGTTQAATQKDAQSIHRGRRAKLEQLRQLLSDADRLLIRVGGQGQPIATGHAFLDNGATHWLLHREDGMVFALTTSREIGPASTAVVAASGKPGGEQA